MRKSVLLTLASLGLAVGAQASVVLHKSFDSDFNAYETLPSTWLQHGIDGVPSGTYVDFFKEYSPSEPYTLLLYDNNRVAFTTSEFSDGETSDQWLITPEFEITEESELLYFTVYASGTTMRCNYQVLLSEGGTEESDFSKQLLSTALQGQNLVVNTATRRVVIDGYAGKKVRLAFVNKNNTRGILGFSDIGVAPYYMQIENPEGLESMVVDADDPTLTFKLRVATTSKVNGLTATLECGNGFETHYEFSGNITSGMFTTISPVFKDIDFKGLNQMPYKVSLRPNNPDLPETIIEGELVKAPRLYATNVVSEEGTGTWCGWCPYGMGLMEYYSDVYDGKEGRSKFIPVAVHSDDPMQANDAYVTGWQKAAQKYMPSLGFPCIMANRAVCEHPVTIDIKSMAERKAYANLYVSRVDMDETDWNVKVAFRPRVSFNADDFTFRASVILLENGLTGTGSQWAQTNNLYQYTEDMMIEEFGVEKTAYLKRFLSRPNNVIPASEMVYNDVVRDAYPSFEGMVLDGVWKADTYRDEEISFSLPYSVRNPENISLVVVLTDNATGQIVAADEVKAADFGKDLSGVGSMMTAAEGIALYRSGDAVVAEIEETGTAEVYSADGLRTGVIILVEGHNEIELPEGLSIIRVTTPTGTSTIKCVR